MIVIIDYGSGNLRSAEKAFARQARGRPVLVSGAADDVRRAAHIVLPGVGAFGDCAQGLRAIDGMVEALQEAVMDEGKPFLGICVGMQLMATRGLEFGETEGFGWISGDVAKIEPNDPDCKIPHMGWNTIERVREHPLLDGIETGPDGLHAYFVHSFHLQPKDQADVVAIAEYGGPVTAMVAKDNMVATQFHPEKSDKIGLKIIDNFINL